VIIADAGLPLSGRGSPHGRSGLVRDLELERYVSAFRDNDIDTGMGRDLARPGATRMLLHWRLCGTRCRRQ